MNRFCELLLGALPLDSHFSECTTKFQKVQNFEYENIDGLLIPSKRMYKASNWNADDIEGPWVMVNWTDIKFNNNLTIADFKK